MSFPLPGRPRNAHLPGGVLVAFGVLGALLGGCAANRLATVEGTVTAGPQCAVQRADEPCPDRPTQVTLEFVRDGQVATRVTSTREGRYQVRLPWGRYLVRTVGGGPPTVTEPRELVVDEPVEHADVVLDTGIR